MVNLQQTSVNTKELSLSTVVPETVIDIAVNTGYTVLNEDLLSRDNFSIFPNSRTAKPVKYLSLNKLCSYLNSYEGKPNKADNEIILKGLYDGKYYNSENCSQPAGFLFFDIDVQSIEAGNKKNENSHLITYDKEGRKIPNENNKIIFDELKKISVLIWRSNSQTGIAGILYVPQLAEISYTEAILHHNIGKSITKYLADYLEQETGIKTIKFDNAQSKFRQARYLAKQFEKRELNLNPFCFSYEITEKQVFTAHNVPKFKRQYNGSVNINNSLGGSIFDKFNANNNIADVLTSCGFSNVKNHKERFKFNRGSSDTSGFIDVNKNVYINFSETVQSYLDRAGAKGSNVASPSLIECAFNHAGNWANFAKALFAAGYENEAPGDETIKSVKNGLAGSTEPDEIFHYCDQLKNADDKVKREIKNEFANSQTAKYFNEYLQLSNCRIKYDKTIEIESYVSECINEIVAIEHGKLLIYAETGTGKTRAITNELTKYGKVLLLEPLIAIVEQLKTETDGAFLIGTNSKTEIYRVADSNLTVSTYEQGSKLLADGYQFDFIVIDEVHQLIAGNSFRYEAMRNITDLLERTPGKIIGLTGTPNAIFRKLGYNFVKVHKKEQQPVKIEVRYCNKRARSIILNHLNKKTNKVIIRLNEINTLKILKNDLIKSGRYSEDEILILFSEDSVKKGAEFKTLTEQQRFTDKTKLVFTTSLIDEGISIDQYGFSDVVYIETKYNPRPEAVKQFFARFRNSDSNRTNYLYLRKRKDQTAYNFNQNRNFDEKCKILSESDYYDSSVYSILSNDLFYYEAGRVNPYYLAYTITENYFGLMNSERFIEFMQVNYNLKITVNNDFDLIGSFDSDKEAKASIKNNTARIWLQTNRNALFYNIKERTGNIRLKKQITASPETMPDADRLFVIEYIKVFEKLVNRTFELESLGIDTAVLFENGEVISDKRYKDIIIIQKFITAINNPRTKTDYNNRDRFFSLCEDLEKKKEYTTTEFKKLLNNHKFLNKRIQVLDNAFLILRVQGFSAKQNKNTKIITVKKLQKTRVVKKLFL